MSAVPAFMLSLLGRQHQLLGDQFFERHHADWLVWEPGASRPSRILSSNDTTLNPGPAPQATDDDDALCFELKRVAGASLTAGRGSENDLVLNDLTVSREQFVLQLVGKAWQLRGLGAPVTVDGAALGGEALTLRTGAVIAAGNTRLTFYSSEGFPQRLAHEHRKHAR